MPKMVPGTWYQSGTFQIPPETYKALFSKKKKMMVVVVVTVMVMVNTSWWEAHPSRTHPPHQRLISDCCYCCCCFCSLSELERKAPCSVQTWNSNSNWKWNWSSSTSLEVIRCRLDSFVFPFLTCKLTPPLSAYLVSRLYFQVSFNPRSRLILARVNSNSTNESPN